METKMEHNINRDENKNEEKSSPWYLGKQYSRYWAIYRACMAYAHKDALSRCSEMKDRIGNTLYQMVMHPWLQSVPQNRKKRISKNRKKKKRQKQRLRQKKKKEARKLAEANQSVFVLMDNDTLQAKLEDDVTHEEPNEVDEDFLTFIETSVKHRIKWNETKEKKLQQTTLNSDLSFDISDQEHPDVVKSKEMEELYGDSASKLHGMETAMQLSFDRFSTLHQPAIWPNIPLKLSF